MNYLQICKQCNGAGYLMSNGGCYGSVMTVKPEEAVDCDVCQGIGWIPLREDVGGLKKGLSPPNGGVENLTMPPYI